MTTTEIRRRLTRRLTPVAAGTGAALVASVSTAFGCSAVMGPMTITPDSGPAGSSVSTTATGLKPYPARYDVFFGGACMSFTGKLLKTITTNSQGGWNNVRMTIPKSATLGEHALCGVEAYPSAGSTATAHDSFTVV